MKNARNINQLQISVCLTVWLYLPIIS